MTDRLSLRLSAIGVMSGTSMDAIDVALIHSDGETDIHIGPTGSFQYPAETRSTLLALIADPDRIESGDLSRIERDVTRAHCHAVQAFLQQNQIQNQDIDLVGFHGQTLLHRPKQGLTLQLLDGSHAAELLQIDCINRFRHKDVEAGGEGAPLAPLYHQARAHNLSKPLAILNLGGVANVTLIDEQSILAFDTGPASALMDDIMRARGGADFDQDGQIARTGQINMPVLNSFMNDPYFSRVPPKSLDRNAFHRWMTHVDPLDLPDALATLAAFTVESIARSIDFCHHPPQRWLIGGGGRHNQFLMQKLNERLRVPVEPVEAVGWNGDMLEAECFAWLAIRSVKNLPLSLPTTTGVPFPMTGGKLHRARRGDRA